jgi:hypothetical protein
VPAELHMNRMQWLLRLRYTLLRVCYMEAWYSPICLVTLQSAYAESYQPCFRFICNSAGTEELPDYLHVCVETRSSGRIK